MKKLMSIFSVVMILTLMVTSCASEDGATTEVDFEESYNAVVNAYGEDYLAQMDLEEEMLSEIYGLNMGNVEEFFAQAPMMSTHVDTFIAVKAKEGMGEEVAADLTAYREKIIADSLNYPMNIPKIQASEVVVYGDYVYFIMLGKMFEDYEAPEEEHLSFYQSETQRGKDALSALFEG